MRLRNKRFLLRAGQGRSMRLWPIFLAILAWASPAAAEWRQAQSSHFIIYSKASEEALRQFATRLERFEGAMRAIHGLLDRSEEHTSDIQSLMRISYAVFCL